MAFTENFLPTYDVDPSMFDISGVFEIHISVDPAQITKLRLFAMKNKVKPILAVAQRGENPNQLMISKWTTGTIVEAVSRAKDIADQLEADGLVVVRVKVEAMAHNKGVPQHPNSDFDSSHYFEFHIKIHINDHEAWQGLEDIALKKSCAVSFNALKDTVSALVTMRVSASRGYLEAERMKDDLLMALKEGGFVAGGEVQKEFSVFDSRPEYDAGWLLTL